MPKDAAAELEALRARTIWDALSATAARVPDREALVGIDDAGSESRLTYAALVKRIRDFSGGLAHSGVKRGDRVVLWMTNAPEWVVASLAAMRIGAAVVPINTFLKGSEIAYLLKQSGARHLIMVDAFRNLDFPAILGTICPDFPGERPAGEFYSPVLPDLRTVIVRNRASGATPGTLDYATIEAIGRDDPDARAQADAMAAATRPTDLGFVKFTSGSTSFPKGVMLAQGGIVANGVLHARRVGVIDGDVFFSMMPFFHGGGSVWGLMTMLMNGGTLVFTEAFDAERAPALLAKEAATILFGALPTEVIEAARRQGVVLDRLRVATVRTDEERETIPNAHYFISPFGLTECYGPAAVTSPLDTPAQQRTSGRMLDGYELRVVDPDTGTDVAPGAVGEAWVRGNIMLGYWNKPEETRRVLTDDGWLRSEDLIRTDADGYITYVGRLKLMLKVGGENVSIEEVEQVVNTHPDVAASACVGVPDARKGERVRSYVALRPGRAADEAAMHEWLRTRLARFKQPREIVFLAALPRLANGKIDRVTLAGMAREQAVA